MRPVVLDTDVVSFLFKSDSRADAWIASTAIVYDAPLITHNGGDYSGVPGLNVITEVSQ
jgi:hypothetical protein